MTLTGQQLVAATGCAPIGADILADGLARGMAIYGIATPLQQAHFLAQVAWESGLFTRVEENLNYSAPRLVMVFPAHFYLVPDAPKGRVDALLCVGHPDMIANVAYGGRMGNGPAISGDGWRYRGRSFIQITGKSNYIALNRALPQIPCVSFPESLAAAEYAALASAWFWHQAGCNAPAAADDVAGVTRRINGGTNGLLQRTALTQRAAEVLGA